MNRLKPYIVGIAGGSGSGKTTLAKELIEQLLDDKVAIIPHDAYYKDQTELPMEERLQINYDHPESLETSLLIEHLQFLKAGQSIELPTYDFANHTRAGQVNEISPKPIILVEGILIFESAELVKLFDLKIFVDTPADVRFSRRLVRDVEERGRTFEFGIKQYLDFTRPMHDQFVEPSKYVADLVIPDGGRNKLSNQVLTDHLLSRIN